MIDSSGSANIFTGDLPIGIHRITFTAFDLCGGTETCEMVTEVKDCFAPTIICGVETDTFLLPSIAQIEFLAKDLIAANSSDNCTDFNSLKFSFSDNLNDSSFYVTCSDIPCNGRFPLELWITDEAGNQSSCLDTIVVFDPYLSCVLPSQTITPIANDWNGNAMENVDFLINGEIYDFSLPSEPCTGYVPLLSDFIGDQLSAESNDSVLNGVSTYDIVLISKHIIGIEEFTDPHQLIAADVNFSNTVTTLDIVKIRSVILQIEAEFIHGKSWVFTPSSHLINGGMTHYFFTGIKLGDVNGSADPNGLTGQTTTTRTEDGTLRLFTKDILLKKEKPILYLRLRSNMKISWADNSLCNLM